MCGLIVRQGPEGRRLNVSPVRKGWEIGAAFNRFVMYARSSFTDATRRISELTGKFQS